MHFSAKVLCDFVHGAILLVVTNNLNMLIACFEFFFYKENVNNNGLIIICFSSTPKHLFE